MILAIFISVSLWPQAQMAAIAGRAAGRHLRRSLRARAARGDRVSWFYGVLKCSWGEIAALVRDEAAARRSPQARWKLLWDALSVPRW